jgi:hypothetical protein
MHDVKHFTHFEDGGDRQIQSESPPQKSISQLEIRELLLRRTSAQPP